MSPQMYLVECVLPKEPRERKALVRRWVVIASSNKDAIYAAAIQAFNEDRGSGTFSRGHRRPARSRRVERVYGRPGMRLHNIVR